MKNKDNIKIKVGQVWRDVDGYKQTVLLVKEDYKRVLTDDGCYMSVYHSNNTDIFHTLISDPDQPWLPVPDGYRLVTKEEIKKYNKPKDYIFFDHKWEGKHHNIGGSEWSPTHLYAVPIDHVWETQGIERLDRIEQNLPSEEDYCHKLNELIDAVNKLTKEA